EAALAGLLQPQRADLLGDPDSDTVQLPGGRAEEPRAGLQLSEPLELVVADPAVPADTADRRPDRIELLLDRLRPLLLGDREHRLERAAVLLDLFGSRKNLGDRVPSGRQGIEDSVLSALDPSCDGDLALAGEQRH